MSGRNRDFCTASCNLARAASFHDKLLAEMGVSRMIHLRCPWPGSIAFPTDLDPMLEARIAHGS